MPFYERSFSNVTASELKNVFFLVFFILPISNACHLQKKLNKSDLFTKESIIVKRDKVPAFKEWLDL